MYTNPIFDDVYLDKLKDDAASYFTSRTNLIFTRTSLPIASGISTYELPEDVSNLVSITYRGVTLIPVSELEVRNNSLFNKAAHGTPRYYIIRDAGYNKIKLWPIPNENIPAAPDEATIRTATGISNYVILSYYKIVREYDDLPVYIQRRLLKYYVMRMAYRKEGESQDLKASNYFNSKLEWALAEFEKFARDASAARYYTMGPSQFSGKYRPPRAVLPPNFPRR